ncbi:MAG TPA: response regulator transcription factor [Steroidobacteraceae bacterium]|nr:response regulator transcription factor [Steroidobacteraceae bacterium]
MSQEARWTMRVMVVSDVRVVQEGLHSVLAQQEGVEVVGTVDTRHAGDDGARLQPDVVLFDAARQDCIDVVKNLVAATPHSKVVAFGVKETDTGIVALAAAGTAGYVRESAGGHDVVRVLEQVLCDELPCSPRTAASLYRTVATLSRRRALSAGEAPGGSLPLSRRELQIAQLIDCGHTNKQIGRELGIEAATVKNHVHNICEKLCVHRRGEVATRIRALLRAQALLPAAPAHEPSVLDSALEPVLEAG